MLIRRTRTRTSGEFITLDYSTHLSKPLRRSILLPKDVSSDRDWHLVLRTGVSHSLPYKVGFGSLTDTLEEGYRAFNRFGKSMWDSFVPLRRYGIWKRDVDPLRNRGDTLISTSNVAKVVCTNRLSYPTYQNWLRQRGFSGADSYTTFFTRILRVSDYPSANDARLAALILQAEVVSYIDAARPSTKLLPQLVSVNWGNSLGYFPTPEWYPLSYLPAMPDCLKADSPEMANARYAAWEALQQGGETIQGMNRLQAVLELKDVPGAAPQLLEFAKYVASVSIKKRWHRSNPPIVEMASAFLFYKFGVQPTVNDLNQWVAENIKGQAIALLDSGEADLHVGDTIRCAYRVSNDAINTDPLPAAKSWDNDSGFIGLVQENAGYSQEYDPLTWVAVPKECRPSKYSNRFLDWSHSGVMFSRALKAGYDMMPEWFWDLHPSATKDQIIEPLSPTKRALMLNPPVRSIYKIGGWSWLVDWFWNVGQTISRIEKSFTRMNIRCGFESLWACDRWIVRPKWPVPMFMCNTVATSSVSTSLKQTDVTAYSYGGVVTQYTVWAKARPNYVCRMNIKCHLDTALRVPIPGAEAVQVIRDEIPKPQIPVVQFRARLDASKIVILGALSITRLAKLRSLFQVFRRYIT